jgi:hypothetical protein
MISAFHLFSPYCQISIKNITQLFPESFLIESLQYLGSYRISDHKNENIQRYSLQTTRVSKYSAQKVHVVFPLYKIKIIETRDFATVRINSKT